MVTALPYIQIGLSVVLATLILIQHSDESLGSAFGAAGAEGEYRTRRGAELMIFRATIAIAVLFVLASFANLIF